MADESRNSQRITNYAEALFAVAVTELQLDEVQDELFRFGRALDGSDELRETLADPHIPASRRQQIVEDLLGGKANGITIALVSMVVGVGRARELPAIITELVALAARTKKRSVAEVRSAIELTAEQQARLAEALTSATGKAIELKVIVDPTVLGGIVAQIGDTVIDGSVRSRLGQLRESF